MSLVAASPATSLSPLGRSNIGCMAGPANALSLAPPHTTFDSNAEALFPESRRRRPPGSPCGTRASRRASSRDRRRANMSLRMPPWPKSLPTSPPEARPAPGPNTRRTPPPNGSLVLLRIAPPPCWCTSSRSLMSRTRSSTTGSSPPRRCASAIIPCSRPASWSAARRSA